MEIDFRDVVPVAASARWRNLTHWLISTRRRARQTIYQQCVLGDRETSAFVNEADAAPDDNSNLASGGHDDSFDIMAALRGG